MCRKHKMYKQIMFLFLSFLQQTVRTHDTNFRNDFQLDAAQSCARTFVRSFVRKFYFFNLCSFVWNNFYERTNKNYFFLGTNEPTNCSCVCSFVHWLVHSLFVEKNEHWHCSCSRTALTLHHSNNYRSNHHQTP